MSECHLTAKKSFTLIELMAVIAVIAILVSIAMGTASYVQRKTAIATTKGLIASMETALESYKSDWGYYPATTQIRISPTGFWESTNNWVLYNALTGAGGRKAYMRFTANQIRFNNAAISNMLTGAVNPLGGLTNICDGWGTPFNYFNSPGTVWSNVQACVGVNAMNNGYVLGGQMNVTGFDLWSYGPDHFTYVPGGRYFISGACGGYNIYPWYNMMWTNTSSAFDDITNFRN